MSKTAWRSSNLDNWGKPSVPDSVEDELLLLLKQPDISYCNPWRKDRVYMVKDANGERIYAERYYLLWNILDIVTVFNSDQTNNASYHTVHHVVAETKNTSILMNFDQ